jgi:hypothetical protein
MESKSVAEGSITIQESGVLARKKLERFLKKSLES